MRIVPASTLPAGPSLTAVMATSLVWHLRPRLVPVPEMTATGRNTDSSIVKATPLAVRTTVPRGIVYDADGSQFFQRTPPVAARRLGALAGRGELAADLHGNVDGLGRDDARGLVHGGGGRVGADRDVDGADVLDLRRDGDLRRGQHEVRGGTGGDDREEEHQEAHDEPGTDATTARLRHGDLAAAVHDRVELGLAGRGEVGVGRTGRDGDAADGIGTARGAGSGCRRPRRRHASPRRPRAAAAAASDPAASSTSAGASRAASYSPTEPKTGSPADAASARAEASGATMSSRRPLTMASRASSLKLIRDVATRDPNGMTRATRVSSAWRMRLAAEVISSSASR